MRDFVIIDNSRFPIAIARYQNFIPTHEEFIKSQLLLEAFANANEDYVFIVDLSIIPTPPNEYRISQAKWISRNNELFVKRKARLVYLTPSLTSQLMIKSVMMFSSLKIPYAVVRSLQKANAWAEKQLKKSDTEISVYK